MSKAPYPIERRAKALADAIPKAIDAVSVWLATPGGRPPFTSQLSREQALDWWEQNLTKPAGTDAYNAMPPQNQVDLQNALAERIAAKQQLAMTQSAQADLRTGVPNGLTR